MSFLYKSIICAVLVLIGSFVSIFIKLLKEDFSTCVFLISNPDFGRYVGELVIFYLWQKWHVLTIFCMIGGDKQHCNVWYTK